MISMDTQWRRPVFQDGMYIFKPKIPIWDPAKEEVVFFWPICLFYGQMVYFMAIWYILSSFFIFFLVLVCSDQEQSFNPGEDKS
jgi:hypothetical protein